MLRFTYLNFILVLGFNLLCPCCWGFEIFLLGFQQFFTERGMLETLHQVEHLGRVLVVLIMDSGTYLTSVRELWFPLFDRILGTLLRAGEVVCVGTVCSTGPMDLAAFIVCLLSFFPGGLDVPTL
jgi:hypothetical protein